VKEINKDNKNMLLNQSNKNIANKLSSNDNKIKLEHDNKE